MLIPEDGPFPVDALARAVQAGAPRVDVAIADGGVRAYLLALLHRATGRPLVVVAPDGQAADRLADGLELFLVEPSGPAPVIRLPALQWTPWEGLSPDRLTIMTRLSTLFRLAQGVPEPAAACVVLPAAALLKRCVPRQALADHGDLVLRGEDLDRHRTVERLAAAGYNRVPLVEEPGTFAVRGGVLDVFCPLYPHPARVEQWGDVVESIRFFDPADQRTVASVDELVVCPVREETRDAAATAMARERLVARADEDHVPTARLRNVLSDLAAGLHFFGVEALLPAFHERLGAVHDYLPQAAITVVIDEQACEAALEAEAVAVAEAFGRRPAGQEVRFAVEAHYLEPAAAMDALRSRGTRLCVGGMHAGEGVETVRFAAGTHGAVAAQVHALHGEDKPIAPLVERIHGWMADGVRVAVVVPSPGRADRLRTLLKGEGFAIDVGGEGLPVRAAGDDGLRAGELAVRTGHLDAGFTVAAHALTVVAGEEVLGRLARRRPPRQGRGDVFQATLSELQPGDLVVHADHGVARYGGLIRLALAGLDQDFLALEFHDGDRLYLPVYRLDRVQRYGAGDQPRRLDKLGGATWAKKRARVKQSVRRLAIDLLELHARRESHGGHPFQPPDDYFRSFEAEFPWEETPDQDKAIGDVLEDMTRPLCMDRLVCGDVGYGKTEVALRAAFLAVLSGKQVAVLCPTTVLAEQHQRTFRQRFDGYPVRVEALSRLVSGERRKQLLADLEAGRVDVMVGTHRLLGKSVRFADLGLLVVDEEHRFGVAHKERLRELKNRMDVLTLTATPIPRTLHMAMGGLKDLSIIATPPVDRQAVRTFVTQRNGDVVRRAVMAELERGGQVFYVHNRINSLPSVRQFLTEVVPEARVVVAHGQMPGAEVEKAMLRFVRGEANVLLSTSIIESGLDIPRANTLVVDDAHMFGLASLYQLRGRVGRSNKRAFAWLLVPDPRKLTDDARKRLEVIQRFTELGAGFHVASYDLEIRGSGELLGPEQSGHISDVGFDTYMELLEEAVAELKGEAAEPDVEPELVLGVEAYLPEDYVGDTGQRLVLYKRLSMARSEDDVHEVAREMVDRFGHPPPQASALVEVMVVKVLARQLGAERVDRTDDQVVLSLGEQPRVPPAAVAALLGLPDTPWRIGADMRLSRRLSGVEQAAPTGAVVAALKALKACASARGSHPEAS